LAISNRPENPQPVSEKGFLKRGVEEVGHGWSGPEFTGNINLLWYAVMSLLLEAHGSYYTWSLIYMCSLQVDLQI
jgi:hypothetical protein